MGVFASLPLVAGALGGAVKQHYALFGSFVGWPSASRIQPLGTGLP